VALWKFGAVYIRGSTLVDSFSTGECIHDI